MAPDGGSLQLSLSSSCSRQGILAHQQGMVGSPLDLHPAPHTALPGSQAGWPGQVQPPAPKL